MMKKIFVCEFITSGGMRDRDLPGSLLADAEIMVQALLRDLRQIDDLDIIICRDDRLSPVAESILNLNQNDDVWLYWKQCMTQADIVWIIAPETDGMLRRLNKLARETGCLLIACDDDAIQLTASKSATNEMLLLHDMPALISKRLNEPLLASDSGWVVKPDDGAGSEDCYFFQNAAEVIAWLKGVEDKSRYIQQRYIPGVHASLSVIYNRQKTLLLSCNQQLINLKQGKLNNEGIEHNDLQEHHAQFEKLAIEIGRLIPGLKGYVGIDLVVGDSGPIVLDINPRLTTSYAGLSELLDMNVAELILNSFNEESPAAFKVYRPTINVSFAI